jgi:hypothetical protein
VRRLELEVGEADLGVAALVADHLRIRHLLRELREAALDLLDELLDHPLESRAPAAISGGARPCSLLRPPARLRQHESVEQVVRGEPEALRYLEEAAALLTDAPPSATKTYVVANLARFLMIHSEYDQAIVDNVLALSSSNDFDNLAREIQHVPH